MRFSVALCGRGDPGLPTSSISIRGTAMTQENDNTEPLEQKTENKDYEAPAIESVMTPQDLDREVQYAGAVDGTVAIG